MTLDRCMEVRGTWAPHTAVGSWLCNGELNQQFQWYAGGLIRAGGKDWCLTTTNHGNAVNGTGVELYQCLNGMSQRWEPTPDGRQIRQVGTTKCITASPNLDAPQPLVLWECYGEVNQRWDARTPDHATCGVSFTAVMTNEDDLLAAYGIPATTDTVRVCETWTGNDYVMRETTMGSAYNAFQDLDTARTVVYSGGRITGTAADGGPAHDPVEAGPTAFDFMRVDNATRQASYDNPYWAVYAGEDPPCGGAIRCSVGAAPGTSTTAGPIHSAAPDTGKETRGFAKHGLKRRGVRALVDDAVEVGRSPEGHRQFKKRRADADVVLTVDKDTELLVAEETTTPKGTTKATHTWKRRARGGYVREQSLVESVETLDGRTVRSRTTTTLLDLKLDTEAASPSTAPARLP